MTRRDIKVSLPEPLIAAGLRLAQERRDTLSLVIETALTSEIQRAGTKARTPNRAEEPLLAPLRVLLAVDFAEARSWAELQTRLRAKGHSLREAGGGLALHSHPKGTRLCKASELGNSYADLMRRFGAPFPGHSHRHLADRILRRPAPRDTPAADRPDAEDDFSLIEPF